jgi:CHASE3 domain sensor protein
MKKIPTQLLTIPIIIILVQFAVSFLLYKQINKVNELQEERRHRNAYFHRNLNDVTTAESGQRGYILTKNKEYLKPYLIARQKFIENNKALTESDLLRPDVVKVKIMSKDKMRELELTIKLVEENKRDSALTVFTTNYGKMLMDTIRHDTEKSIKKSTDDMIANIAAQSKLVNIYLLTIAAMSMFIVFFLIYIYINMQLYHINLVQLRRGLPTTYDL